MQELGNIGQRMQVLLELALGNQKEHDEIYRLIVQGVKTVSLFRAPQRADDFVNQIC